MAADRLLPVSTDTSILSGNDYLDAVAEEVAALWKYVRIPLTAIAGTANLITASLDPPLVGSLTDGMSFLFTPVALNTGPTTIAINSGDEITLADMSGRAFDGGETIVGRELELIFNGTSGHFRVPLTAKIGVATISTDTILTLTVGSSKRDLRDTAVLTADRIITLSTVGATEGDEFVITRSGSGAFNRNVGPGIKNLAAGTWGRFVYDEGASAWYLAQGGSL